MHFCVVVFVVVVAVAFRIQFIIICFAFRFMPFPLSVPFRRSLVFIWFLFKIAATSICINIAADCAVDCAVAVAAALLLLFYSSSFLVEPLSPCTLRE